MLKIMIYVIYHVFIIFNKTNLRTVTILKDPIKVPKSEYTLINEDVTMPSLYNGTEFSFSLWVYLESFVKTTKPKLVLLSGSLDSFDNGGPIVYLDPNYVTMHILFRTSASPKPTVSRQSLEDLHRHRDCDYLRISVDYVPMQRWVNVTTVVDNEYVQLLFDGELRKVVDITDTELIENIDDSIRIQEKNESSDLCVDNNVCCLPANTCCPKRLISVGTVGGPLYIGKIMTDEVFDGYMSKVQFFNYAITIDHAKVIYKAGPIYSNLLSKLGISTYGIRNPFYKINSTE